MTLLARSSLYSSTNTFHAEDTQQFHWAQPTTSAHLDPPHPHSKTTFWGLASFTTPSKAPPPRVDATINTPINLLFLCGSSVAVKEHIFASFFTSRKPRPGSSPWPCHAHFSHGSSLDHAPAGLPHLWSFPFKRVRAGVGISRGENGKHRSPDLPKKEWDRPLYHPWSPRVGRVRKSGQKQATPKESRLSEPRVWIPSRRCSLWGGFRVRWLEPVLASVLGPDLLASQWQLAPPPPLICPAHAAFGHAQNGSGAPRSKVAPPPSLWPLKMTLHGRILGRRSMTWPNAAKSSLHQPVSRWSGGQHSPCVCQRAIRLTCFHKIKTKQKYESCVEVFVKF